MYKVENKCNRTLFIVAIASLLYLIWQFVGLRHTNHDDIFLHLSSQVFANDYYGFAKYAAFAHNRLQAFINMPIILWVNSTADTGLYDVLSLGVFASLCISFTWVIGQCTSVKNALALSISIALLFPLHYYFAFPQSYPVMAAWPLACFFISMGLYNSHLYVASPAKKSASLILFLLSLWGPEYNFLLHPIILLMMTYDKSLQYRYRELWNRLKPYVFGWFLCFAAYWSFSMVAREKGMDTVGRMSLNFSLVDWIKTFVILQEKSFLPLALIHGIRFSDASVHGGPHVPALLTYVTTMQGSGDCFSLSFVFVFASVIFAYLFYKQTITLSTFNKLIVFFICFATIPSLIVSASRHYQEIVLKGYLQGHLITFYSQVSLAGIMFAIASVAINFVSTPLIKHLVIISLSFLFAAFTSITFVYNNVNRQTMMANAEKWNAFKDLSQFVYNSRPELKEKVILAPAFWDSSGVSSIPNDSPFSGKNYWTEYSELVLKSPLKISNKEQNSDPIKVEVNYLAVPKGNPVVVLDEVDQGTNIHHVTLVSKKAIEGELTDPTNLSLIKNLSITEWNCQVQCIHTIKSNKKVTFKPSNVGPRSLIAQFFTKRYDAFALGEN